MHSPPPTPENLQSKGRSRSVDRSNELHGLQVLYRPDNPRAIGIIFVRGLGGISRLTWSWDRHLNRFWPKERLPLEPGFKDARVLSCRYNANFLSQTVDIFNISDFAKDLLLQVNFGSDENKRLEVGKVSDQNVIGELISQVNRVHIIFLVHSMGGVVFKKVGKVDHGQP